MKPLCLACTAAITVSEIPRDARIPSVWLGGARMSVAKARRCGTKRRSIRTPARLKPGASAGFSLSAFRVSGLGLLFALNSSKRRPPFVGRTMSSVCRAVCLGQEWMRILQATRHVERHVERHCCPLLNLFPLLPHAMHTGCSFRPTLSIISPCMNPWR